MRTPSYLIFAAALGLGLTSCNRSDKARNDERARELGKESYRATQDIKRGAKNAAQDLRNAGKQFRQGWNEAQHENPPQQSPGNSGAPRR